MIINAAPPVATSTIVDVIYPVGSIYLSVNNTNPSSLFGGTWERIKDKFLLGSGDTYTNGSTGGEASHTLTVDEMPSHTHNYYFDQNPQVNWHIGLNSGSVESTTSAVAEGPQGRGYTLHIREAGSSQPHNNLPPYLAVYIWKRTA